jgi:hypothetical protein
MDFKTKQENRKSLDGRRVFLGPLNPREEKLHEGFMGLEMNEYENMQKKHLHAYLLGDQFFFYKRVKYNVESKFE